ncbi:sulfotransferase [Jannaschia aquimarina]|uniref:Sulfotransferase domain protein n=1 Tax=Jannaschia aquimarina TaxID=935700 RepID=A0A0D1CQ95_9RHOB|nr:sulfotransferase [Jannaschia aquimarina]KIT16932.1 hypothetical protein jaqu_14310 [Jannaschia aquimarina]SNT11311.1 Sulfotransferase family protein [Jannaschia aquimarina]
MAPQTVLHVGLPKAASSTLQQRYLSRHPQIGYLALPRKAGPPDPDDVLERFVTSIREDHALGAAEAGVEEVRKRLASTDRPIALLSEERFTGHMGAGINAKANFAARHFPGARIILSVRNPLSLLRSNYAQHLRHPRPGIPPVPRYDVWLNHGLSEPDRQETYVAATRIGAIGRAWVEAFGREAIFVILFEEFRADPVAVLSRLADWLGIDADPFERAAREEGGRINPSPSASQLALLRATQRLRRGNLPGRAISRLVGALPDLPFKSSPIPKSLEDRLAAAHASDCDGFAETFGVDLTRWSYPSARGREEGAADPSTSDLRPPA